MTDNIDISKTFSLAHYNQLENMGTTQSLQKVKEEIQQAIDVVDSYNRKVDSLEPPMVNGEPWYKMSFGKASVAEVNKAFESFSAFVQETFKMVAKSQNFQSENDMNICRLIGLLAIAEAKSYEQLNVLSSELKDLSTEDEKSAKQLKELGESFMQSLNDATIDSKKKEEQMTRIIDYVALFAETKTKKIRSITLTLSEIQVKLEKYCTTQDNWVSEAKEAISSWQEVVNANFSETKHQLFETINNVTKEKHAQIDKNFASMKESFVEYITKQENKIAQEQKKQNEKLDASTKVVEEKIEEYKSIIENQTNTIATQTELLKSQNELIGSLRKKINVALLIGVAALISTIGAMAILF